MTGYEQGNVVLVRFIFTDETGAKRRPAVIVSTGDYHRGRHEAIIAAITSNVERLLVGDHLIVGWREAGLLFPSVATGIIRTIKQDMIECRLGVMPPEDVQAIQEKLRLSASADAASAERLRREGSAEASGQCRRAESQNSFVASPNHPAGGVEL